MVHTRRLLGSMLVVIAVLRHAGAALAQDASASGVVGFIVDEQSKILEIAVHPKVATIIHFDSPVLQYAQSRYAGLIVRQNLGGSIVIRPNRHARAFGNLQVMTRRYDVSLRFRFVDRPELAAQTVEITRRDRTAEEIEKLQRSHEQHVRTLQTGYEQSIRKLEDALHEARMDNLKHVVGKDLYPITGNQASNGNLPWVRLGRANWDRGDFYPSFELCNPGLTPLQVTRVRASSGHHVFHDPKVLLRSPRAVDTKYLLEVPVGECVQAGLLLSDAAAHGIKPLAIELSLSNSLHPIVAAAQDWTLRPMTEEEIAEEEGRKEELRREREAKGRRSLHLQALGGFAWLGDGIGLDQSDATFMTGLGVRATYGFNSYVGFEAELMGASTRASRFRDVTLDGMQGDLERSASLGRAQLGGVLRLGTGRYIPIARLGLGLQGASHDSRLITGAGEVSVSDSFEWNTLFAFGAGVDARLGPFLAGIAASVVSPWGKYELFHRSIEAVVHLGYAWNHNLF